MTNNPTISIIVPIYNVENYLIESLDSIKGQSFKDWECILVDDGSPDNSGAICDKYAAEDSRFHALHIENSGVSTARNKGLEVCRGRYITFLDPDDSMRPDMLSRMHELILEYDADVVQVNFYKEYTNTKRRSHLAKEITILDRKQIALELLKGHRIPNYVWNKLFKREVIDTPFPKGMLFEDIYVMSHWLKNMHKMVIAPDVLYDYRQRRGSTMHSNYAQNRFDYLKSMEGMAKRVKEIEPDAISDSFVSKCEWRGIINAAKDIARYENNTHREQIETTINKISDIAKTKPNPSLSLLGYKLYVRAILLRKSPRLFALYIRWVKKCNLLKKNRSKKLFK